MPAVRVTCPATSANLGPGFDSLGIALRLSNEFEIEELSDGGITIAVEGEGADGIPRDPQENLVVQAFQATRRALGREPAEHLSLALRLQVPPSSGLGSSATATLAGILSANTLAGDLLDRRSLVQLAVQLEGHPDNVVPCLAGGLCAAVRNEKGELTWLSGNPTNPPTLVVAHPRGVELRTDEMREILPDQVSFQDATWNVGHAALLVFALLQGDRQALAAALDDRLHQPYRGPYIPGFGLVCEAARQAGSIGTVISGSGPALLSFCPDEPAGECVAEAMQTAWHNEGIAATARILGLDPDGARVATL